jgi:hypothetical protein
VIGPFHKPGASGSLHAPGLAYKIDNITSIGKTSPVTWVSALEIHNEGGFPTRQMPLSSCPSLGFLIVSLFHSVNGAIDGLNGS